MKEGNKCYKNVVSRKKSYETEKSFEKFDKRKIKVNRKGVFWEGENKNEPGNGERRKVK